MADKKFDIQIVTRAVARGAEATLRALKSAQEGTKRLAAAANKLGSVSKAGFDAFAKGVRIAMRPLKAVVAIGAAAGATLLGLAGVAVKTAGNFELLRLRLNTVLGSAEKGNKAWKETFKLFTKSPMDLEPLIEARIILEGLGVKGPKALESLANAASAMDRPVEQLARVFGSMEPEPLYALGIVARQQAGKFVFTFRDRMNEVRKIAVNTRDDAQQALLKIFDIRFGGGLQKMSRTLQGLSSTFGGLLKGAFNAIGEGPLLDSVKRVYDDLTKALERLTESGRLQRFGAFLAKILDAVWTRIKTIAESAASIVDTINKLQSPQEALRKGFILLADIFLHALVAGLVATKDIWVGIAKMMSGIFGDEIRRILFSIPGVGRILAERQLARTKGIPATPEEEFAQGARRTAAALPAAFADVERYAGERVGAYRASIGAMPKRQPSLAEVEAEQGAWMGEMGQSMADLRQTPDPGYIGTAQGPWQREHRGPGIYTAEGRWRPPDMKSAVAAMDELDAGIAELTAAARDTAKLAKRNAAQIRQDLRTE